MLRSCSAGWLEKLSASNGPGAGADWRQPAGDVFQGLKEKKKVIWIQEKSLVLWKDLNSESINRKLRQFVVTFLGE